MAEQTQTDGDMRSFDDGCARTALAITDGAAIVRNLMNHPVFKQSEVFTGQFGLMKDYLRIAAEELDRAASHVAQAAKLYTKMPPTASANAAPAPPTAEK